MDAGQLARCLLVLGRSLLFAHRRRPTPHGLEAAIRNEAATRRLERLPRHVLPNGRGEDAAGIVARDHQTGHLPVGLRKGLYRARSRLRLLDVGLRVEQSARVGRHRLHRAAQTTAHLPALVPPRHRHVLLVVFLLGVHGGRPLVRRHELHRPLGHVLVLRVQGAQVPRAQTDRHGDHDVAVGADGRGVHGQRLGYTDEVVGPRVSRVGYEHQVVALDVRFVRRPLRTVLL